MRGGGRRVPGYAAARLQSEAQGRAQRLFGSKLRGGFDAHVAAVSQVSGFEAVRRSQMQYLEIVIDQEAQVLPLAILWVRPPL